jgi:hypothetical protein
MSIALQVADKIAVMLSQITGCNCVVGCPTQIAAGDVAVSLINVPSTHTLNESGGTSDIVLTLKAYDCQGIVGSATGDREAFDTVSGHVESLQTMIESDVTLAGLVTQIRIKEVDIWTASVADNSYECYAEISLEVSKW